MCEYNFTFVKWLGLVQILNLSLFQNGIGAVLNLNRLSFIICTRTSYFTKVKLYSHTMRLTGKIRWLTGKMRVSGHTAGYGGGFVEF